MAKLLETAVSNKARLRLELAGDLPAVDGDAAHLGKVVLNLLTNAVDALQQRGGEIVVRTGVMELEQPARYSPHAAADLKPGTYVFVEVSDNGCGMPEETLERIFDPFFSTKFAGRGLGLAAALGIVHGHRGLIKVTSQPSAGSTFQVLLPASAQRVPAHAAVSTLGEIPDKGTVSFVIMAENS